MRFEPEWTMRDCRAKYFSFAGFAPDGGYSDKWVKLKVGRATLAFPNTAARVRSVKLHDLHHVLTEYETTWSGEAEIAAWEIASGCGRHYPAWILNFGAFAIGLLIAPIRIFDAFVRGRRNRNLYRTHFEESLLNRTVGEVRAELSISSGATAASRSDVLSFVLWSAVSALVTVLPSAAAAMLAMSLCRWLFSR
jgi:hypothetical protein